MVPNGVTATTTADAALSAVMPSSVHPSVRSVSTRSAPASSDATSAWPRLITDFLPAARYPNSAPGGPPAADQARSESPCGDSIFTTSAPASANILPQ